MFDHELIKLFNKHYLRFQTIKTLQLTINQRTVKYITREIFKCPFEHLIQSLTTNKRIQSIVFTFEDVLRSS